MSSQYKPFWLFTVLMLIMLAIVLVLKILENFKSRNLEKMNTEKNESVQI